MTEEGYRALAQKLYHHNEEIEIDDNARVACWDLNYGVYVQAWVWVDKPKEGE